MVDVKWVAPHVIGGEVRDEVGIGIDCCINLSVECHVVNVGPVSNVLIRGRSNIEEGIMLHTRNQYTTTAKF